MGVIYEPKNAAKEYADLALNMYIGCQHGCIYCYAPRSTFKKKEEFINNAKIKDNIIERLEKNLKLLSKKKVKKLPVLMSFSCDPYQPIEKAEKVTRVAIQMLNEHKFPVRILTKGGKLAQRDFDLLVKNKRKEFGVSLTLTNKKQQIEWEPRAATYKQRVANLKKAKKLGIKTWVSLEPILDLEQTLNIIDSTHDFVDRYGVSKLNYNKHQRTIDWKEAKEKIVAKLKSYNKKTIIHKSLKEV